MNKCPICGDSMRGHPKCQLCGVLMGPGHFAAATYEVEGHHVCKACAQFIEDNDLTWKQAIAQQREENQEPIDDE